MRRFLLTLSAIFLLLVSGLAQKRTITGTVNDEKGNPLSNATVQVKGTTTGTTTNPDGTYHNKCFSERENLSFFFS